MRMIVAMLFVCVLAYAHAHTLQEEVEVARFLSICIQSDWDDNVSAAPSTNLVEIKYQTYDDLLQTRFPSNHVGFAWTRDEREDAIENFLDNIPVLSTNGLCRGISGHAGIILGFCRDHGQTNVLGAAMRILSAKGSAAQGAATSVFADFAVPSDEINAFAANMLTNEMAMTSSLRSYFLDAYVDALIKRRTECRPACFTNGVALVIKVVDGREGSTALDQLLMASFQSYENSSNRLAVARAALADTRPAPTYAESAIEDHFIPITNRLMNAPQPLPEVPELRNLGR